MQLSEFLTQKETALLLKLSERTLERWRITGENIPFIRAGRRVLYSRQDIENWARENTFRSTAEAAEQPI